MFIEEISIIMVFNISLNYLIFIDKIFNNNYIFVSHQKNSA